MGTMFGAGLGAEREGNGWGEPSPPQPLNVTLVTVHADDELMGAALDAADRSGWSLHEAHFAHHISARRRPHFGSEARHRDGCVALVDFDADPEDAAESARYLHQVFPERLVVVAVSTRDEPEAILQAMRAGCAEYVVKGREANELEGAFVRVAAQLTGRDAVARREGSIFAFFGAKGGVGTTTLAVHLATLLAGDKRKKVLFIDSHLQFGHACIYLGVDGSNFHFQELVRNVNRMDSELLGSFLARHKSGLDVLSSPEVGKAARLMHPDDVAGTLEFLRGEYDLVLVDCAAALDDVNRVVIAAAAHAYVVATPEISAVRDLSRFVDDLLNLPDTRDKVRVILNRYSSQLAIGLDKVEKAIRMPVHSCISNNYVELVRSANLGEPVGAESKSAFSQEMQRWAHALAGTSHEAGAKVEKKQPAPWRSLKQTLSGLLSPWPQPAPELEGKRT